MTTNKLALLAAMMALVLAACSEEAAAPDQGVKADSGAGSGKGLQVLKQFRCYKDEVKGTQAINDVGGLSGATIDIRATAAPCQFDLLFTQGGKSEVLSKQPGGYLVSVGGKTPSGDIVVCASNIVHGPAAKGVAGIHGITGVQLECAVKHQGSWTALTTLAGGGEDWAAWAQEIEASSSDPGLIKVTYIRDFSFQFVNISDRGRPSTDGVYSVSFKVSGGALTGAKTAKVSDKTVDPKDIEETPWDPTDAELKELAPYVVKDEGKCPPPDGCKLP